ncbi:VCBS repeat-containing protein, partial [bacterium]|nr:VCBS repeat-containing protein [bacterium]
IDDDGDLDLYVCVFDGSNRLYINRGNGTFEERAAYFGLNFSGASVSMSFSDYDLDGDLDAFLLTNNLNKPENINVRFTYRDGRMRPPIGLEEQVDVIRKPDGTYLPIEAGQYDHLYRNNGDGTFSDVSEEAGIEGNYFGLSATWWDYDRDGDPDLYVANDFYGPDQLFSNNGDGTFTDVIQQMAPHTPWYSMGSDSADIDNNGGPDLRGSDMAGPTHYSQKVSMGDMGPEGNGWFLDFPDPHQYMRNALYLNYGVERFAEAAQMLGVSRTDWTWSVRFADIDLDGWSDLFITNGMTRDWFNSDMMDEAKAIEEALGDPLQVFIEAPMLQQRNLAYRNTGNLEFENVGRQWGLDHLGVSFGAALGDLDNDGDLDIVINNFDSPAALFENGAADAKPDSALELLLEGRDSNR